MYKYLLLLLGAASLISSCGKEKPQNPESVFYLGDIEVRTKDFNAYCINGKTKIRYSDYISTGGYVSFSIGFNYSVFPNHYSLHVSYGGIDFDQCNIGFHIGETQYLVDRYNSTYLYASMHSNGKGKYILTPTWFYSQIPDSSSNGFIRGNDSILVQGTFYEPNDVVIR